MPTRSGVSKPSRRRRPSLRRGSSRCLIVWLRSTPVPCPMPRSVRSTDRKSTRLNSSHVKISYAVFCLKKKIIARLGEERSYSLQICHARAHADPCAKLSARDDCGYYEVVIELAGRTHQAPAAAASRVS